MAFYKTFSNISRDVLDRYKESLYVPYSNMFSEKIINNIAKTNASELFKPKHIIYNDPATIVFWNDGTKTVVKKSEGEPYNKYNAFCAALAKKVLGNNSIVNKIVKSGFDQKEKENKDE